MPPLPATEFGSFWHPAGDVVTEKTLDNAKESFEQRLFQLCASLWAYDRRIEHLSQVAFVHRHLFAESFIPLSVHSTHLKRNKVFRNIVRFFSNVLHFHLHFLTDELKMFIETGGYEMHLVIIVHGNDGSGTPFLGKILEKKIMEFGGSKDNWKT